MTLFTFQTQGVVLGTKYKEWLVLGLDLPTVNSKKPARFKANLT